MNFYKNHRKLILYCFIFLISILLIYLISFPLVFLISPILFAPIYFISKKLGLQPRDDFLNFLSSRGLKIKFYKFVIAILKLWNLVSLILMLLLLVSIFILIVGFIGFVINTITPKFLSTNLNIQLNLYIYNFAYIVSLIFILVTWCGIIILSFVFPPNKLSGLPDSSNIVISFIKIAIDEINSFDFSLTWDDTKRNKNKISNLVNDASEFITVEDRFFAIPLGMRYFQQFIAGLNNKSAKMDILYRINGLYEELNEIIVELNCMNTVKDKEDIANKLNKYLIIIENKNLCDFKKVDFKKYNVIWNSTEKIFNLFYYLIKIIFRF